MAVDDICEDEDLFTLPYSSTLTVENSTFYAQTHVHLETLQPWAALVLVLIFEHGQGSESPWWPYLSILPKKLDTLMFWSQEELLQLKGSTVLNKIGKAEADELFEMQLWPVAHSSATQFGWYSSIFARDLGRAEFLKICHRMASLIFAYGFDHDPDILSDVEKEASLQEDKEPTKIMMVPLADLLNADGDLNNVSLVIQLLRSDLTSLVRHTWCKPKNQ